MPTSATLPPMGRAKKPDGSKGEGGKKPDRKTVAFPADWYALAEGLAEEKQQPILWYLIGLLQSAGEAAGRKDLPEPPWKAGKKTEDT